MGTGILGPADSAAGNLKVDFPLSALAIQRGSDVKRLEAVQYD